MASGDEVSIDREMLRQIVQYLLATHPPDGMSLKAAGDFVNSVASLIPDHPPNSELESVK
jgi:hypothetical protein